MSRLLRCGTALVVVSLMIGAAVWQAAPAQPRGSAITIAPPGYFATIDVQKAMRIGDVAKMLDAKRREGEGSAAATIEQSTGLKLVDIERVTLVGTLPNHNSSSDPWFIVTTSRAIEREKVVAAMRATPEPFRPEARGGRWDDIPAIKMPAKNQAIPSPRFENKTADFPQPPRTEKKSPPAFDKPGSRRSPAVRQVRAGRAEPPTYRTGFRGYLAFADDRTMIYSPDGNPAAMACAGVQLPDHWKLSPGFGAAAKSLRGVAGATDKDWGLSAAYDDAKSHLAGMSLDGEGLLPLLMQLGRRGDMSTVMMMADMVALTDVRPVSIVADVAVDLELKLTARFPSERAAKSAEPAAEKLRALVRGGLAIARSEFHPRATEDPAVILEFLTQLDAIVRDLEFTRDGAILRTSARFPGQLLMRTGEMLAAQIALVRATQGMNNLKQIGIAMHNYHDNLGRFPPAGGGGRGPGQQLSWRVHLLPYLEQAHLYGQFRMDQPWDSPANKAAAVKMPAVFETPGRKAEPGHTYFQVFTGPDTAFRNDRPARLTDIHDGTSNTLMVVEGAEAVSWTKPDADLTFTANGPLPKLPDVFLGLFFDGSTRRFDRKKVSDDVLRLYIMPRDGQPIAVDD